MWLDDHVEKKALLFFKYVDILASRDSLNLSSVIRRVIL